MPFESIESLRKRIKENLDVMINVCDVDDTLIKDDALLNEQTTKRILKDNIFAVATLRASSINEQSNKNPLHPLIKEAYTHQDIIVGSRVKESQWKQAEQALLKNCLSELLNTVNVTDPLPTIIKNMYRKADEAGMPELVGDDELFILMIDVLANAFNKRSPIDYKNFLHNLIALYQAGEKDFLDLPPKLIREGFVRLKGKLISLIIDTNDVELFKSYYQIIFHAKTTLKNEVIELQSLWEAIKRSSTQPKELALFIQRQLTEKQQAYYIQFAEGVGAITRFMKADANTVAATWKSLLEEVEKIKEQHKISDIALTLGIIYEAAAYFDTIFSKKDIEKLKVSLASDKVMDKIVIDNLYSNYEMKKNAGKKAKLYEPEIIFFSSLPVDQNANNHIIIEKNKNRLIIFLDKGLPTEIKLSLPNHDDLKYSFLTSNKFKQFIEICYQLRVIPDKTPAGIELTCGKEITPIAANRFTFMDDAKDPVKIASMLGITAFHVLTEPVVAEKANIIKVADSKINTLIESVTDLSKSVFNANPQFLAHLLIFVGNFTKLHPDMRDSINGLLKSMPDEFNKDCLFIKNTLDTLARLVNIDDSVKLLNGNIQIDDVGNIYGKTKDILNLLNQIKETLVNISRLLEKEKNNYINRIMDQRNNYIGSLNIPPVTGLKEVLQKLEENKVTSGLFSTTVTTVKSLSESDFLLLQRLADCNNFQALEALGSYLNHHGKDNRRILACYQLAYFYCNIPAKESVLLEKLRVCESEVLADKVSSSNAYEIARFRFMEDSINATLDLYNVKKLSDIYFSMACGSSNKDIEKYKQNLIMAFYYCEIAYHLISPQDKIYQSLQIMHQNLINEMSREQLAAGCVKLVNWYNRNEAVSLLDNKHSIKSTAKYHEYLQSNSPNPNSFAKFMADHYQAEHNKLKATVRPASVAPAVSKK